MEVRQIEALDKLLRGRRDLPAPVQHHTNSKIHCLCVQMGEESILQWVFSSQEGASADNQSKFEWCHSHFRVNEGNFWVVTLELADIS